MRPINKIGLTDRHDFPIGVDEHIYPFTIKNVFDLEGLEIEAFEVLKKYEDKVVHLYVTGLTQALIAVLNVSRLLNIKLTLYHYDKVTSKYFPQEVI